MSCCPFLVIAHLNSQNEGTRMVDSLTKLSRQCDDVVHRHISEIARGMSDPVPLQNIDCDDTRYHILLLVDLSYVTVLR